MFAAIFSRPGRYPLNGGVYKRFVKGQDGRSPNDPSFFILDQKTDMVREYLDQIKKGWKRDRTFKGLGGEGTVWPAP